MIIKRKRSLIKCFSKIAMGQPFDERCNKGKINVMELEHKV